MTMGERKEHVNNMRTRYLRCRSRQDKSRIADGLFETLRYHR